MQDDEDRYENEMRLSQLCKENSTCNQRCHHAVSGVLQDCPTQAECCAGRAVRSAGGSCTVWKCPIDEDGACAVDIINSHKAPVQVIIASIAEKVVLEGAVRIIITAALLVLFAQAIYRFGFISAGRAVVIGPRMDVRIRVNGPQPYTGECTDSKSKEDGTYATQRPCTRGVWNTRTASIHSSASTAICWRNTRTCGSPASCRR